MTRPNPPSPAAIAEYWSGRAVPGVPDYFGPPAGEPTCFACGWSHWFVSASGCERPCFHRLERAHVVPHSRGGSMSPANLALLCAPCHTSAPDTTDALFFWRWVALRDTWMEQRLAAALSVVTPEQLAAGGANLTAGNLRAYVELAAARLRPVAQCGRMSDATVGRLTAEVFALAGGDDQDALPLSWT